MPRVAVFNPPGRTLAEGVERARLAERLGYESVWVTQLPDARDAAVTLSAYALATERVGLGTGVLPIYTRHPALMVQMAAALDELSGGRFRLGIGVSHQVTVEAMWGLRLERPLQAMREYVEIVRSGLRDRRANVEGQQFTARWSYSGPARPDLPILISALNPKMLELAGEIADGVVLWMCSPAYVRDAVVPRVQAGLERAGRDPHGFEIVAAVPACLTSDPVAGRDAFRPTVTRYAGLPFYRRMLDASGFREQLERGEVSDEMVDELAGIGGPEAVQSVVRRYREAGCTLPAVGPFSGHPAAAGFEATLEAAAA